MAKTSKATATAGVVIAILVWGGLTQGWFSDSGAPQPKPVKTEKAKGKAYLKLDDLAGVKSVAVHWQVENNGAGGCAAIKSDVCPLTGYWTNLEPTFTYTITVTIKEDAPTIAHANYSVHYVDENRQDMVIHGGATNGPGSHTISNIR